MQDAINKAQIHQGLAKIISKYAALDNQLSTYCGRIRKKMENGNTEGIFPCQQSQIRAFLEGLPNLENKISNEPQLIVVTGRRALTALNGFIFAQTILEDEVFFRSRTLFIVTGTQQEQGCASSVRIFVYNKGCLTLHKEISFECLRSMNQQLALELLTLEFEKSSGFDGLLVEIGLHCPHLGRLRIAAASRVDTTIKELLDPHQPLLAAQERGNLLIVMHFFAPEMERRLAESELSYVRNLANQSRLLLLCQHYRGKRAEVTEIVYNTESSTKTNHNLYYFTQWQWDGLKSVKPELETALDDELRKRSTRLAKAVTKELCVPFRVVHQIKRNINLSKNIANRQRRPREEYMKDFNALRSLAAKYSDDFRRKSDARLKDASESVAQHLRIGRVRNKIIENIISRAAELKNCSEHKLEIAFLEAVAKELREWNSKSEVLNKADEVLHQDKLSKFKDLCTKAVEIQEIILVSDDMLSDSSSSGNSTNSRDSLRRATIQSVTDDMVRKRLRTGRLETFAAGIAAPLWVPLAAITMAIIVPVIGAQKNQENDEKFKKELRGLGQDFLDRLDSQLIRTQFFERVKQQIDQDSRQLREFIECFCILPSDQEIANNAKHNVESLTQSLVELESQLQQIQGDLMMLQLEKLGCEVLSKEDCAKFGIDIDVTHRRQLGTELVTGKPIYLVSPQGAEKPMVLKVAPGRGTQAHRLLLEIDILKAVSNEPHNNIIPWLGTVYFPNLQTVGFLTLKYDCDLWQFIEKFDAKVVPYRSEKGSPMRGSAFAVCRVICNQLFAAVHQLHKRQILHRDLKPENVLMEIQNSEQLRFVTKLCDFGLAKHESEMSGTTFGGTNGYMAPEILQVRPAYSDKSDIYALGVIAWECLFGMRLRENNDSYLRECRTGKPAWDYMVQTMTSPSPVDRPLIPQCMTLLLNLDKKPDDQESMLFLNSQLANALPSLKESMLALSKPQKG